MRISEFQELIRRTYGARDRRRSLETNTLWLMEEVGELAEAIRRRDHQAARKEIADVLAWLVTVASHSQIDVEKAALAKYGQGCPRCGAIPCDCPEHPAPKRWRK
ncbi:MAG: nucleotide pyrophosphohydrolase [Planctomycetes bacterium]|nr:nucleotide pyrophosphohydrolase [Planctomycetota bacterium]